ncbi:MAG: hypothetical protein MJZ23_06595 [Paludibacteraceae bacterium]|nr:hypothetical protein [Paludibacteraceae bacterium]
MTIPALTTSSQSGPSGEIAKVNMYKYKEVSDSEVIWAAFLAAEQTFDNTVIEYTDGKQNSQCDAISNVTIKSGKVNTIQVSQGK